MSFNLMPDGKQVDKLHSKPVAYVALTFLLIAALLAWLLYTNTNDRNNHCEETDKELRALRAQFLAYVIKTNEDKRSDREETKKRTDSAIIEAINKNPNIK